MPIHRRCLVPGCKCNGYAFDMETYEGSEEEIVESGRGELKPYCSLCGHTEAEHELAPAD